MREYKFRVWDKISKRMVYSDDYGCLSDFFNANTFDYHTNFKPIDTYVLMEYTGSKDKNGKQIYEGDIVKSWWDEPFISSLEQDYEIGEIIHNENMQGYSLKIEYKNENLTPMMNCFNKFEIIDNKYENPELLEDDTND